MGPPMRREPAMPPLEPHRDPAAASLVDSARERGLALGDDEEFTFPADEDFWDNFSQQAQLSPDGQREPYFEVTASHKSKEPPLRVNQDFVRGFVGAWEQRNPHVVTVRGPEGELQFHASHEFWNEVIGGLRTSAAQRPAPSAAEAVQIRSGLHPNAPPVVAHVSDWNEACDRWEQEHGCTAQDRAARAQQRKREIEAKKHREKQSRQSLERQRLREQQHRRTTLSAEPAADPRRNRGSRRRGSPRASSESSGRPRAHACSGGRPATFALSAAVAPGMPAFCAFCGSSLAGVGPSAQYCSHCGQQLRPPPPAPPAAPASPRPRLSDRGAGGCDLRHRGDGFWAYGVLHYHIHNPYST
eukprot:TRINITY_DN29375_c0_g1_i1.p1 TRINITY_DN29375_c0_g1~~TRINITY_DN29375_c0_g1_i1.p1  ORF type:complete len:384 (+),score=82.44 TRINITY_DN29375_c0_g1_i1:84-1154(+)